MGLEPLCMTIVLKLAMTTSWLDVKTLRCALGTLTVKLLIYIFLLRG